MKLYTEEQAKYFFECGRNFQMNGEITFSAAQEALIPIELPSDEEIEANAKTYADHQFKGMSDKSSSFECINDFKAGAEWVIEKIKQQI